MVLRKKTYRRKTVRRKPKSLLKRVLRVERNLVKATEVKEFYNMANSGSLGYTTYIPATLVPPQTTQVSAGPPIIYYPDWQCRAGSKIAVKSFEAWITVEVAASSTVRSESIRMVCVVDRRPQLSVPGFYSETAGNSLMYFAQPQNWIDTQDSKGRYQVLWDRTALLSNTAGSVSSCYGGHPNSRMWHVKHYFKTPLIVEFDDTVPFSSATYNQLCVKNPISVLMSGDNITQYPTYIISTKITFTDS